MDADALRAKLPPISMAQLNWMLGQDCERNKKAFEVAKKKVTSHEYYAVVTAFEGWQVVRYCIVSSSYSRNGYKFGYISEVSQRWMRVRDNGKILLDIFEKRYCMFWYNKCQPYALDSQLSWKSWGSSYNRRCITAINLEDWQVYPIRRFTDEFKKADLARALGRYDEIWLYEDVRDGKRLKGVDSLELDKSEVCTLTQKCYLPTIVETLFKMGEDDLARFMLHPSGWNQTKVTKYWLSFLIARRHGMRNDFSGWMDWFDYVADLDRIGKDIHNPHFLVPQEGVHDAHAKVIERLNRIREKLARERERAKMEEELKRIEEQEKGFYKRIRKYLGLAIVTESGITITPLPSVTAFYEEGNALHHCVYTCGYYAKKESLILTARSADGDRVETIEVDLGGLKVLQSRGFGNKPTPILQEILMAMDENMWRIDEIAHPRRARKVA